MTEPLISIVVGIKNGAQTLEPFIDSFVRQSLGRKELVIKDAGSTDGTVAILERRSADLAWWTSEPDTGLYEAWNTAISHCRGKYVGFLGCDDEFADDHALERLAAVAEAQSPALICSLNVLVTDDGKFIKTLGRPWSWGQMRRSQALAHACLLHRRDLFETKGLFDTSMKIGGDYEWLLRLGKEPEAAFVDNVTVRVGSNGMSHRLWRTTFHDHWNVQRACPNIGFAKATRNYAENVGWYLLRKARGKR